MKNQRVLSLGSDVILPNALDGQACQAYSETEKFMLRGIGHTERRLRTPVTCEACSAVQAADPFPAFLPSKSAVPTMVRNPTLCSPHLVRIGRFHRASFLRYLKTEMRENTKLYTIKRTARARSFRLVNWGLMSRNHHMTTSYATGQIVTLGECVLTAHGRFSPRAACVSHVYLEDIAGGRRSHTRGHLDLGRPTPLPTQNM